MYVGSSELAIYLLKAGAKPDVRALIGRNERKIVFHETTEDSYEVSALLAPFISGSKPYETYRHVYSHYEVEISQPHFVKSLCDKIISSVVSPVVDNSDLINSPSIQEELMDIISLTPFSYLTENPMIRKSKISELLFGGVKAGLQQLCIRTIFNTLYRKNLGK